MTTSFLSRFKQLPRFKQLRWYHWLLVVVVFLYLVYIALSYWYLPDKLKQVVETDVSDMIGRKMFVQAFHYNPFALSMRVTQFEVEDKPDYPLVAFEQLFVDFGFLKTLFSFNLGFQEIVLDKPRVNIEKHGEEFNFSDILKRLEANAENSEEEPLEEDSSGNLALEILRSAINQGVIRFVDYSGEKPAQSVLDDITIEVEDLYLATGDDHLNPYDVKALVPGGGEIRLAGQYRLEPLHVESKVVATEIQLATFSDFLYNQIPLVVSNGSLSVSSEVLVEQKADDVSVLVKQGKISLRELALDDEVVDPPLFRIASFDVDGIEVDLLKESVTVQNVNIDGVRSNMWLNKQGQLRHEPILAKKITDENVAYHQEDVKDEKHDTDEAFPWDIQVVQIKLQNSTILFTDQNEQITQGHSLKDITFNMENLSFDPEQTVKSGFSVLIDDQGRLESQAEMKMLPFDLKMQYSLDNLQLKPFSEYVEAYSYLRLEKGSLGVKGSATFSNEEDLPFTVVLDTSLDGFMADDSRTGKPVLAFDALKINSVDVNSREAAVKVKEIALIKPDTKVVMSPKQELNLATLAKPLSNQAAVEEPEETSQEETAQEASEDKSQGDPAKEWQVSVAEFRIENGKTDFTDQSLKPPFKIALDDMQMSLKNLGTHEKNAMPLDFASKIDRYAPFTIKGELAPLEQQPGFDIRSRLSGLEMTGLSPYSGVYIGNNLKSGSLSLDIDYSVKSNQLKGANRIEAKDLYLGEKVESEQAVNAPVGLGLALLRDLNGVIDLNVDVSGDLNDPGFSIAGIVGKAIVNVIVKAAASPFSLLGSLVGGGEELGHIEFLPGRSDLGEAGTTKLTQLSEALKQKPSLVLSITGNAVEAKDKPALQHIRVQEVVSAERKLSLDELREEAGETDWWQIKANRKSLNKMAEALNLPDDSDLEDQIEAAQPDLDGDALDEKVYQTLYDSVAGQQSVDNNDLLSLAEQRAISIKQYLVEKLQLDHERVTVHKAASKQLTDTVVNLQLEAR